MYLQCMFVIYMHCIYHDLYGLASCQAGPLAEDAPLIVLKRFVYVFRIFP